jgi:cell division protein FtsW (lipid II flippase)
MKKVIGILFVTIISICLFAKTGYFNSKMRNDSEFEYQKIMIGGLVGLLGIYFMMKYI